MSKIGVLELEAFFPSKERFELAMALNNLLAAPGFSAWMEGEPLDLQRILHTPAGKPRVAIFSIAHLNDAERMFFVSLLLNQTLGWMRAQSGTTSLRALLYMDEIFGYLPPVANPPSKIADADAAQAGAGIWRRASFWRRRIQWTSTTRRCRTPAPGSSAGCRPSATRRACSTVWRARRPLQVVTSIGRRWAA